MQRPSAWLVGVAIASGCYGILAPVAAAETTTQVTTYVIKVQEERQQTRWSLTEWLKIKERMKLMDLWLAMFSDPKKDKFQPELMLSYQVTRAKFQYKTAAGATEQGDMNGGALKGQLWLTNLISSTIGIRTLNIDLGAEAYHRQSGPFKQTLPSADAPASSAEGARPRRYDLEYYTGALRIFGRNIQDSSLVLKYGRYAYRNDVTAPLATTGGTAKGTAAGGEVQLYILKSLGVEGNYMQFGDAAGTGGFTKQSGVYYDYAAFLEISLLRLIGGPYVEEWTLETPSGEIKTQEKGFQGGLKLQF